MRSVSLTMLLVPALVLSGLPFAIAEPAVSAGGKVVPHSGTTSDLPPPCILGLIFCPPQTQCNDGIDNDGDGETDYGSDPSCDSSSDNDEYTCVSIDTNAEIQSTGTKYGTDVAVWPTIVYSCPGGARFSGSNFADCSPVSSVGWTATPCAAWAPAAKSSGAQATYTCGSSACSGTVSPHTLKAAVVIDDNEGNYHCEFQATSGVPFTTWCSA